MNTHKTIKSASLAILLSLLPLGLGAQQQVDGRWSAFLGCWEADVTTAGAPMLCVLPHTGGQGVDMVTVQNSREATREWVSADGTMQESTREGCRGWERARFSEDGRRIYLDSQHTCDSGGRQETSGMLAMIAQDEWIDIRTVMVAGQKATGVIRYKLAPADDAEAAGFGNIAADRAMAVRTARITAAAPVTVNDVIDATHFVDAEVTRTWIAERGEAFRLNSSTLVRMADASVPSEVIDVMVAVTYPRSFQIGNNAQPTAIVQEPTARTGYPMGGTFWDPWMYGYPSSYGRYGYGSYGYGRYGYGPYGYGDYGFGYQPTVIVVQPGSSTEGQGRVVNGRGYSKSPTGTSSSSGSRAPSTSSGSSGSTSSSPSPAPASEPSSSGSSGGTSTGRTAQPRPPQP
jgi:hypothetical protein